MQILVEPSLGITTTYLVRLIYSWEERRRFLKKYSNSTLFTPKLIPLLGGGSLILRFLVSLPYRCHIPNLVKIGELVLDKKMYTHDERQMTHDGLRTTQDDGRRPLKTGHLIKREKRSCIVEITTAL